MSIRRESAMLSTRVADNHARSALLTGTKWIAAAVIAAVVPAPFLVIAAVSLLIRRPFLGLLTRSMGRPSTGLATRLTIWWTAGLAAVTVGEAVGAAVGAMDILKVSGFAAHTFYGLGVVAILVTGTVISLRRA